MIMKFTELGNLDKIVAKQFVISCGMVLMLKIDLICFNRIQDILAIETSLQGDSRSQWLGPTSSGVG